MIILDVLKLFLKFFLSSIFTQTQRNNIDLAALLYLPHLFDTDEAAEVVDSLNHFELNKVFRKKYYTLIITYCSKISLNVINDLFKR